VSDQVNGQGADDGVSMTKKTIHKGDIDAFIAELLEDYTVFAPAKTADVVAFREITSPQEVVWDVLVTRLPPKEVLFPQTQTLFAYTNTGDELHLQSMEAVEGERILWGVRPCDVQAMLVQDAVLDAPDPRDVYYTNRREKTTVVAIGCNQPLSTCFCTMVGGGPFKKEGADVFLTDAGDVYVAEALTAKGKKLLQRSLFQRAKKADLSAAQAAEERALAKLPAAMNRDLVKEHLDSMIDDPFWDRVQATCLGCGICTMLCPVCYCFDIVDEGTAACGQRVRNWDTCQYCIYTLEGSGHNPRPGGRERVRQRLMHKFDYHLVNQNVLGCVGCGRCVQLCPVNIDIRQLLSEIGAAK
jgi:sulfhydrogenase subunit beta (sulfur reductase)